MLPRDHERKVRKLRILAKRLDRMIGNGHFYALPFWRRYALVRRVKRLYGSLMGPVAPIATRVVLAGAAALALAACQPPQPGAANNPSFAAAEKNPFGFAPVVPGFPVAVTFSDVNRDGTLDMFAGAGGELAGQIRFFANTGTGAAPSFAAGTDFPGLPNATTPAYTNFGPVPVMSPPLTLLKGGPRVGMIIGHSGGSNPPLEVYLGDGSSFSPATVPANLPTFGAGSSLTAAPVDINGDGLVDVFVSSSNNVVNTIDFWKNTGTAAAPLFTDQVTSLGLDLPTGAYGYPTFVDIDGDGDFDAFVANEMGDIYYFQNTGTPTAPQFAAPVKNPFGITPVPAGPTIPTFVDIDHDGDYDLFVGDTNGDLWFYRNVNL